MKINHPNGTVTDTDRLNDCSAELMERVVDFFEFCKQRKIPFLLRFCDPNLKAPKDAIMSAGACYWENSGQILALLQSINVYFAENSGLNIIDFEALARLAEQKRLEEEGNSPEQA